MSIQVNVDVTNPGQFFACCGLLELADRLWPGAQGWFEDAKFRIDSRHELEELIEAISTMKVVQLDRDDDTSSSMELHVSSRPLLLDWWHDTRAGGKDLKVWAGTMESVRIAQAMQDALRDPRFGSSDLFNVGMIVYDPKDRDKKVEPYYFDARRAPNAHSRDVGFSPNDLSLTTTAFPAVELLCLVGLQRCLPVRLARSRVYDYCTWTLPLPPELLPAAVCGEFRSPDSRVYRFENGYRTGQRKHKAFFSAIPL